MKMIGLDIGDKWTGIAISDPLGILAKPHDTVKTTDLHDYLTTIIATQAISTVIVGLPTTLRGTNSQQTEKVISFVQELEKNFPTVAWQLWDERLTSKQAASIQKTQNQQNKLRSHAIAAALILSGYLEFQRFKTSLNDDSY